jgi:hypothetical protein
MEAVMASYEEIISEIVDVYLEMGRDPGELTGVDEDEYYYFFSRTNGDIARVDRSDAEALFGPERDRAVEDVKRALSDFRDFF